MADNTPEILGLAAEGLKCCDTGIDCCDNCCGPYKCTVVISIIVKIAAEILEIISESLVLGKRIIPTLHLLDNDPRYETSTTPSEIPLNITTSITTSNITGNITINAKAYKEAAYSYMFFYTLGLLAVLGYWIFAMYKKKTPPAVSIVMAVVLEMPLMVSEMCLLKAQIVIDWNEQFLDLILQICFLVNVFLQIYFEFGLLIDKCDCDCGSVFAHIFILALDFLFTCALYAPVMWAIAGWHWFDRIHIRDVKGIITSENAANAMNVLLVFGHVGQFILSFLLVFTLGYCRKKFFSNNQVEPE